MSETTEAGTLGYAPTVVVGPDLAKQPNPEQAKYAKLWQMPQYREVSPGEQWATQFLQIARPEHDADAIDFGCGTGRGGLSLALFGSMRVTMLDFAENCLDSDIVDICNAQPTRLKFQQQDLTKPVPVTAAYGFCCDVMEHIPTEDVLKVLQNILGSANRVFFGISTVDDAMGALIGERLHLTVQPMEWWIAQLESAGAVIHWAQAIDGACGIYCSSWLKLSDIDIVGRTNVEVEEINQQTRTNILAGWQQATPFETQAREVVLLAGGPSMLANVDLIKSLRAEGCALVTTNGAYAWAIEQGMVPSAQVVLDARAFNARFTSPQVETCRYLIASQVHPSTLKGLPHDRTYLWHSGISQANEQLVRERYGIYYPVPGGSTVVLRALPLLRMLGFKKFHIFGFDSCSLNGSHHSYPQLENDDEVEVPITCAGRTFSCTGWQVSQANEFQDIVKFLGDEVELNVVGDGLIAWMIKTGAGMASTDPGASGAQNERIAHFSN